jgi:capsular polysaccharide biosynthesis protein
MYIQKSKSYCSHAKLWLEENSLDSHENYFCVYSDDIINRCLPTSIYDCLHPEFENNQKAQMSESFVVNLPDAYVWGSDGIVISSDLKLICDISREFYGGVENHRIFKQQQASPGEYIDACVALLSARSAHNNYFHWLFESLPRFHLIKQAGYTNNEIDFFLVSSTELDFQRETLEILGLPSKKIISGVEKPYLHVKELLATSVPPFDGRIQPWVCEFLRSTFLNLKPSSLQKISCSLTQKLYISRKRASKRGILNENDVIDFLEKEGFLIVHLEDLSTSEQVEIFKKSCCIISSHGAGLSNLVFCNPKSKVIEIFSPNYIEPLYWYLCNLVNLEYFYFLGQAFTSETKGEFELSTDAYYVDIQDLKKIMKIAQVE